MKILVVGDSCLDTFIYGDIERIAPEEPIIDTRLTELGIFKRSSTLT